MSDQGYPVALVQQIETIFDLIDADGNGHLDFNFKDGEFSGEMGSDLGKRILVDLGV